MKRESDLSENINRLNQECEIVSRQLEELRIEANRLGTEVIALRLEVTILREQIKPLQKIVYGVAGLILVGVATALLSLVLIK